VFFSSSLNFWIWFLVNIDWGYKKLKRAHLKDIADFKKFIAYLSI